MSTKKVRRSVVIPGELAESLSSLPPESGGLNFNRLVIVALEEYVNRQQQRYFAEAMKQMADDEEVQQECRAIAKEFGPAESDGLDDD